MSIYANKMDNFIEMYNLPKLNQKEIDIMSDQSQVPKIKTLIKKNLPSNKIPVPDGFTEEFYPTFREELIPVLLKLFQKIIEGETLPNSFSEATIMLTPKLNKDILKIKENIIDEHRCTNPA